MFTARSLSKRPMIGEEVSGPSRTFTQSETHWYLPGSLPSGTTFETSFAVLGSLDSSYFVRSMYWRLPGDGRTSSGTSPPSGIFVSWPTRIHLSPNMSAAYSLLKRVGFSTQAPMYPVCSLWQRPYTCPPHMSATVSRSLKPIRPKTSRMCAADFSHPLIRPSSSTSMPPGTPTSGSGSRPGAMASSSGASERPPRKSIFGPPVCSIALYAASTHRSAKDTPGNFSLIGSRSFLAASSPVLPGSFASRGWRIVAPLEPPVISALQYVPDECQPRRMRTGA
mmetsp:Transcript_51066/g.143755  ORF Transcript_51066/g.143755 Transcript_51066/m.143755 type:complete len:280 (-) Transcript_51066:127-966(-)